MDTIFSALLSNVLVASCLALVVIAIGRVWRNAAILHVLWLVVLLKLVTPPLISLACLPSWQQAGGPEAREGTGQFAFFSKGQDVTLESKKLMAKSSSADKSNRGAGLGATNKSTNGHAIVGSEADSSETGGEVVGGLTPREEITGDAANSGVATRSNRSPETNNKASVATWPRLNARAWMTIVWGFWVCGSVIWFCYSAIRMLQFGRALRLAIPAPQSFNIKARQLAERFGMSDSPTVLLLPGAVAPMIWAPAAKSFLLLPKDLVSCIDPKKLDALIGHEMGHLRLRHHWVRRFEWIVSGLYWWCPLVWLARHKLREYEEEVCDAWVVTSLPGISEAYAHALLDTVDFLTLSKPEMPPAAIGISHFQYLNRRISVIMQKEKNKPNLPIAGWLVVIAIMALGLPLSPTSAEPLAETPPIVTAPTVAATPASQDDWKQDESESLDDIIKEVLSELTQEIGELNHEIDDAIKEAREEIREGISDVPPEVRAVLAGINVDQIIDDALRDAPPTVKMFVREVDPAGIIAGVAKRGENDDEQLGGELNKQIRDKVTKMLESRIGHMSGMAKSQAQSARGQITRGVGQLPPQIRQQLADLDIDDLISSATQDSNAIVKQFVKDVKVAETIKLALQDRDDRTQDRDRAQDRDRTRDRDRASRDSDRANRDRQRNADRERSRATRDRERAQRDRQRETTQRDRDRASQSRDRQREREEQRRRTTDNRKDSATSQMARDRARARLEQRLERMLEEVDALRKELRQLDDQREGDK